MRGMKRERRNPQRGLSQLELLVSLVIMAMVTVLLANALNFNRQALDRARGLSDSTDLLIARTTLRDWMEDMPVVFGEETAVEFFDGQSAGLRFKAYLRDQSFWGGETVEISLSLQSETLRIEAQGVHPNGTEPLSQTIDLARDVSAFEIGYFGRRSTDSGPTWHAAWQDRTQLPDLVKIEWEQGDGVPMPPLTLQPALKDRQSVMSLSSLVPPG